MPNYYPRRVNPADSLLFDAAGHLVGLRSGTSGQEEIFGMSASKAAAVDSLVSGAGNPTDLLTGTLQHVNITGAISTTATLSATATGTYTKARVVWNNNGASGSAKLRIAVNADNDVHGLMIGQSAKRRDYEMTMGDGVMLVCGVPITRLTFSADGAITGGTHQLQVTFGN